MLETISRPIPRLLFSSVFFALRQLMPLAVFAPSILTAAEPSKTPIPTNGLVAYYPFNGNAEDASGNGNHASVTGASLAEDKFGTPASAYYLDGNGEHLVAPVCISPSVMPQVTLVVWARAKHEDNVGTIFAHPTRNQRSRALLMRTSPGRGGCWATSTNENGSWAWHKVVEQQWTFLALSYDQNAKKICFHVNDSKYERDCSQIDGTTQLHIGKNPLLGQFFHGSLDEVRIYNRMLSDEEVARLYMQFQSGNRDADGQALRENSRHQGLMWLFIAGFSLFTGIVLIANIMIRRKSS